MPAKKVEAAAALKLTAPDLLKAGDHRRDHPASRSAARTPIPTRPPRLVDDVLSRALGEVAALDSETRLDARYEKFRSMGRLGIEFVEG